jgi:hypothetical protein
MPFSRGAKPESSTASLPEYTVAGNISRWNQRWNGLSGGADYHLGYDAADQLLGAEVRDPISGVLQKTYGYAYAARCKSHPRINQHARGRAAGDYFEPSQLQ